MGFNNLEIRTIIVDVINEIIFQNKNGVFFLNKGYFLENVIDDCKGFIKKDVADIIFNEKHMADRICEYKKLQCEHMQDVHKEHSNKEYMK